MNRRCKYETVAYKTLKTPINERLFSDLYTHYWYKVFRHSYEYTGSKQEAEDMAQEVFLKLWQNFDRINGQLTNVEGYLFIMTRNSCHNHYKKEIRKLPWYKSYCQTQAEAYTHDDIVAKEIKRIAIKAVQQLPEKQRKVYIYRDLGLGRKEIATILRVSVNTIDANITIAMKKVQQYVSRELNLSTAA
ncbi:RNA polymerase sigma factor [Longitalea arenae]|uniref:RNA polymerase sigma factor n=1 Tax=Longitalea arenae TaxID=2812558 RepID=UPI0019673B3D|nr:sigma-70 family RNA polymerase sigma factor [Longitalea arenae]